MNRVAVTALLIVSPAHLLAMEVVFSEPDRQRFSAEEIEHIEELAGSIETEVRRLLPALPESIFLEVRTEVQPYSASGATGAAIGFNRIAWVVDTPRSDEVVSIANATLRGILFHELHHLARGCFQSYESFIDGAVCEGMATAFARDFGGAEQSWASYPPEVADWFYEVRDLPASATTGEWMFFHPDGRVRIGYKVGTYLVDRAMQANGKTAAELTDVPSRDVVRLAGL